MNRWGSTMKKSFMFVSALIVMSMLFVSACSSNKGGETPETSGEQTEKTVELDVAFPIFGAVPKDLPLIQDAINKITREKINATVKLLPISVGNWTQQINLMLAGNEKLDLMVVFGNSYSDLVAKGQIVALNKLVEDHGKGITEALDSSLLNAASIKGSIYGVPSIRDFAANSGLLMRKDLVDKYKIDVTKIRTLDDVEATLKIIKENEPDLAPLVTGSGMSPLVGYQTFDPLGDSIGVLPGYDNDLKVINWYESQVYADLLKKLRNWYTSGLILKDAATNKSTSDELIKSNRGFAYLAGMKPGYVTQVSNSSGVEMVAANLTQPTTTTTNVSSAMWGIPYSSTMPEKAMDFLNLMYSDKDIINLLDYGIEGTHYVVKSDNVIDYPEGVDAQSSGYSMNMGWLFGNQFLSYVFNGDDPKLWEQMDQFNDSSFKSKALGFTFDIEPVKSEYAAVSNAVTEYQLPLETGSVDPDKVLPEFISKLKAAGIDKIIAEKQKQLDEWASTKK